MLGTVLSLKSLGSNMLLPKLSRTRSWVRTTSSRKSRLEELNFSGEIQMRLKQAGQACPDRCGRLTDSRLASRQGRGCSWLSMPIQAEGAGSTLCMSSSQASWGVVLRREAAKGFRGAARGFPKPSPLTRGSIAESLHIVKKHRGPLRGEVGIHTPYCPEASWTTVRGSGLTHTLTLNLSFLFSSCSGGGGEGGGGPCQGGWREG